MSIFRVQARFEFLECTQKAEPLLFSMVPLILTFNFDLILGSFLSFQGSNGCFGLEEGLKTFSGSSHIAEQLLFPMLPSILIFDFDQIWGCF